MFKARFSAKDSERLGIDPSDLDDPFRVIDILRRHGSAAPGDKQGLFDLRTGIYLRVVLANGAEHWVVSVLSGIDSEYVGIVAIDPETRQYYAVSVSKQSIAQVEALPPKMIERLPPAQQPPFGFNQSA